MSITMPELHVGICGAGIGGLAAAIAIAKAGAKVTVLEAALELGEIGAGIQMTPNVARLLIKWGVDKVIGDDLVEFEVYCLPASARRLAD
jgi:salicylate hydroxylase